jgi:hypothetical protein
MNQICGRARSVSLVLGLLAFALAAPAASAQDVFMDIRDTLTLLEEEDLTYLEAGAFCDDLVSKTSTAGASGQTYMGMPADIWAARKARLGANLCLHRFGMSQKALALGDVAKGFLSGSADPRNQAAGKVLGDKLAQLGSVVDGKRLWEDDHEVSLSTASADMVMMEPVMAMSMMFSPPMTDF